MSGLLRLVVAVAALVSATSAVAEDAYYQVPLADLKITDGGQIPALSRPDWRTWRRVRAMQPRVVLDVEGEAYLDGVNRWSPSIDLRNQLTLLIRAPEGQDTSGTLYVPKADWDGMVGLKFTVPAAEANPETRRRFYATKQRHYEQLLRQRIAGAAWFRHQARQARIALDPKARAGSPGPARPIRVRQTELTRTYALFTGGRAMSENLQLDRELTVAGDGDAPVREEPENGVAPPKPKVPMVELDSITGITVEEIDWEPLIRDLDPKLDPLASQIPADQHAVFFPTFQASVAMADEAARQGISILQLAEPQSEGAQTFQRYQRQLCLTLDGASRLLGPQVARSVAMTGSDPYFRTGTDVAVLLEAADPQVLGHLLLAQISLAAKTNREAVSQTGEVGGVPYRGLRTPDRSICCYIARVGDTIVVTNSLYQLGQLVKVDNGELESLASLPEYTFFRDRYRLGDPEETALVFLSDATIRRWCGPRWRIATSRRIRNAAVMAEVQASQMDALVGGTVEPGPVDTELPMAEAGPLAISSTGVSALAAGTLAFMTPIAELPMSRVTKAESVVYRRWRDGYQRNWTIAFDPIGIRLGVHPKRVSADVTVMPLIVRTQYRELMSITKGAKILPEAGDPHNALAHFIMAINLKSPMFREMGNFAEGMGVKASLSWLGESVAIYADEDPFWEELAKVPQNDWDEFFLANVGRVPVAAQADVSSGLKLALFLTAVRGVVEQTAPGMTVWESLTYKEQPYVKVTPSERAKTEEDELENLALYYSASGKALVVTLSETMLKRAIDRQLARAAAKTETQTETATPIGKPWLGSNVCLQVDRKALQIAAALGREQYRTAMQIRAWGNLPILNEWKRRYPDRDPIELHEQLWNTRLICPGEGTYVWNDELQTMESTVFGQPGAPKPGPATPPALAGFLYGNFGLSFEEQGLRASVSMDRQ